MIERTVLAGRGGLRVTGGRAQCVRSVRADIAQDLRAFAAGRRQTAHGRPARLREAEVDVARGRLVSKARFRYLMNAFSSSSKFVGSIKRC
jgi:hypothetical protein